MTKHVSARVGRVRRLTPRADGAFDVPLTRGFVAVVDACDVERVQRYNWNTDTAGDSDVYARGWVSGRGVFLHRFILGVTDRDVQVDHKNGNQLDCRRDNLRLATQAQNTQNRRGHSTSGKRYKGAFYVPKENRWRAMIRANGKTIHLGRHLTEADAARAYDTAAVKHFGEFARLNFPQATQSPEAGA